MSELPRLFEDVSRWYAVTTLALGIRTGLADALLSGGGTAAELAATALVDPNNAARWADGMVVAGYATVTDGRYEPLDETVGLLRGGVPIDVRAVVELLVPLGSLLPRVATAIRDGGGIESAEFQAALGMTSERVNGPMYRAFLLDEWIAGHPDLAAALERGIDVAEVGPGSGTALRILASAFPASRFVGYDVDVATVREAVAAAADEGLANLRFEAVDGGAMPRAAFDLVCVFDAFHHVNDPSAVLDGMRAALRPGGSLLLAESAVSGDPTTDAADPTSPIIYGCDLVYCYQESKLAGRTGTGATWPGRELGTMLADHGFAETGRVASQAGYVVIRAVPLRA